MRILVVEDHPDLAANVGDYLEAQGHRVDFAADGEAGLRRAGGGNFDLLILDRMLPLLDGAALCRRLRAAGVTVPVLMLTAMDAVGDRVSGLEAGADDYLIKPFAMAELKARLEALYRRASGAVGQGPLRVGDLCFDPRTLQASRAGQPLPLNPSTRKILECLMRESPRVVRRETLEQLLWGDEPPDGDVLRAHMHNLRATVDKPFPNKLLHTVHGVGFRLAAEHG